MENKVILVFLDGVGVDSENPDNPFAQSEMKFFKGSIGGTLTSGNSVRKEHLVFKGIDACLGVKGTPQSATGQTALFTGMNAPRILGYHYPAFPNDELKQIIKEHNIYLELLKTGKSCTFANAYTPLYFKLAEEGKRRHSVTTVCMLASGLRFRGIDDLRRGEAVYWDITNKYLKEKTGEEIDLVEPYDAGKNLARLTDTNSLVVFECFMPDLIGHDRSMEKAIPFCSLLDEFVSGIATEMPSDTTLVITSDHGNMEDLSTSGHTTNPALLFALGNRAAVFQNVNVIDEIKNAIVSIILE